MATLIEQIQSFLRAERSQQAFDESLRSLSEGRQSLRDHPVRSTTFDMHIQEARGGPVNTRGKMPQSVSLAWDEQLYSGAGDKAARNWMNLTPRERKDVLLAIYLANPWVSACVDVIAKRITSGGLSIEPIVDKPNEAHLHQLEDFCLRINDDWDLLQYVRACITDELIFGDTYSEIVFKNGLPFQIYKIDCLTMNYKANRFGQIEQFSQQLDSSREPQILDPKTIIRWWFPHPRSAVEPFSPIERIQDAINIDKKMVNWMTTFFQKGAKFPYYVKGVADENEADRFMTWFKQNFTGEKNAHIPPVTWGTAEFVPLGNNGALDMDFDKGQDKQRTIVLSGYHVPPAIVGIIESGNIGGGTGEDQEKSFQYNTCDPIRHMFFEKFNYRIVQQGFGIHDYRVSTRYADYRTDDAIAKIQDERIRNGSMTINEVRGEMGKQPHPKGGDTPLFAVSKEVIPVERLDEMPDEQRKQTQQSLDAADMNNEILKTKVDQAKNPQPQQDLQPGQQQNDDEQPTQKRPVVKKGNAQKQESTGNTGIMIAFMLDPQTASRLAIPGGEDTDDLHITLVYMGDKADFTGDIDKLKTCVQNFASWTPPLKGVTSGVGRFNPNEDGISPTVVFVNIHELTSTRRALTQSLKADGFTYASDFAYTPHITLSYDHISTLMRPQTVPETPLWFTSMCLVIGDNRYYYPLGTDTQQQQMKENSNAQKNEQTTHEQSQSRRTDRQSGTHTQTRHTTPGEIHEQTQHEWRQPTPEQLACEKQLETLLSGLVKQARDGKQIVASNIAPLDDAILQAAIYLERANALGLQYAAKYLPPKQEAIIGADIATSLLGKAQNLISRALSWAADLFSSKVSDLGDDATEEDLQAAVADVATTVAETLGLTEIQDMIEETVLDQLKAAGVANKIWVDEPGACEMCIANAAAGAIGIDESFPSGHDQPTAHNRCRCHLAAEFWDYERG